MTETITRCLCDICKKDGAKPYRTLAYRTFDSTDGRSFYERPKIVEAKVDLCDDCAIKVTNLYSVGIQCEEYALKSYKGALYELKSYKEVLSEISQIVDRYKAEDSDRGEMARDLIGILRKAQKQ